MTDFEIAIERLTRLATNLKTPQAVAGDLALVLCAANGASSLLLLEELCGTGKDWYVSYLAQDDAHWSCELRSAHHDSVFGKGPTLSSAIKAAYEKVKESTG